MSMMKDADDIQGVTQTSQIIVGSLAAGVIAFWAVITLVIDPNPAPAGGAGRAGGLFFGIPMLTAFSALFGVAVLAGSILVPRLIVDGAVAQLAKGRPYDKDAGEGAGTKQLRPEAGAAELLPVYQTQLIVASALNEGGAFFAAIAYMLERHSAAILVAGVLLALLLSRFPTVDRVRGWIEAQLERVAARRRDDF